jgi:sialidase-1
MFDTQVLFRRGELGYVSYRIPALLATPRGVVLAFAEARRDGGNDWGCNDLVYRRSTDCGRTWDALCTLAVQADYGEGPVSNPALCLDPATGDVVLLFCWNYARVFLCRSTDDGATFSAPEEITAVAERWRAVYAWRVVATGPGHGLTLRNGRMVVPVWLSTGESGEFGGKLGHRPSCVSTLVSDDGGRTWQVGEIAVPQQAVLNPSESTAEELSDGRVLLNVRSEAAEHRRLVTISADGATGWSTPAFHDALPEPICLGTLKRLSWAPNRLLFVNPAAQTQEFMTWGEFRDRANLTVRMSEDDGATWPVSRSLEPGITGYADLAVLPDGTVLCLSETAVLEPHYTLDTLTLTHFDLAWLAHGEQ